MKQPQELMTMYIIPAVRNQIVKELKELGIKQEEIAKLLDVTPSAISQYIKDKRGCEVQFCEEFLTEIKNTTLKLKNNLTEDLIKNQELIFNHINNLVSYYKKNNMLCEMCKNTNNLNSCNIKCK